MKTKHTPGPWEFNLVRVQRSITGPRGGPVAYTHGVNIPEEEDLANARLISAAPEMLEALCAAHAADVAEAELKRIFSEITESDLFEHGSDRMEKALQASKLRWHIFYTSIALRNSAIKKATGGQS